MGVLEEFQKESPMHVAKLYSVMESTEQYAIATQICAIVIHAVLRVSVKMQL